ncbi:MAG TPA: flagellar biosynthesis anti-sigma factor FlgM [Tepidiformaceae bacterium]|nr:flagellar biosynthesis anti-sigma factor FlgM [Tepidiformaceae bacterium]
MAGVRKTSGPNAVRTTVLDLATHRTRAEALPPSDPVDLAGITPRGKELAGALGAVATVSDVRVERVLALREQIRNGAYRPDPREIARRLMERGF